MSQLHLAYIENACCYVNFVHFQCINHHYMSQCHDNNHFFFQRDYNTYWFAILSTNTKTTLKNNVYRWIWSIDVKHVNSQVVFLLLFYVLVTKLTHIAWFGKLRKLADLSSTYTVTNFDCLFFSSVAATLTMCISQRPL